MIYQYFWRVRFAVIKFEWDVDKTDDEGAEKIHC